MSIFRDEAEFYPEALKLTIDQAFLMKVANWRVEHPNKHTLDMYKLNLRLRTASWTAS